MQSCVVMISVTHTSLSLAFQCEEWVDCSAYHMANFQPPALHLAALSPEGSSDLLHTRASLPDRGRCCADDECKQCLALA